MSDQPLPGTTPSKASPPFDDPSADIILRTPDPIEFDVHSNILSLASPFFSRMLSLPQPAGVGSREQRPVIDVSEESQVLDRLLRLCYPTFKPNLSELADIIPVFKAALEYDMEWLTDILTKNLLTMTVSMPLRTWAAACRVGLEDVAREAACHIRGLSPTDRLESPSESDGTGSGCSALTQLQLLQANNLQNISAGDYFRLLEFLRLEPEALSASFRLLSPSPSSPDERQPGQHRPPTPLQHPLSHRPDGFIPRIPSPDVLLQCRDCEGVQHRVHGVVLALHSTLLGEQLIQVQVEWSTRSSHAGNVDSKGTSSNSVELPVLRLDITSDTLVSLLTVCYDGPSSLPSSLAPLASMLLASHNLHMSQIYALVAAQWEVVAKRTPLEAYFVAIQHNLQDQARAAARNAVELPGPLVGSYVSVMEDSPALSYHRLLVYYDACVHVVGQQLDRGTADWNSLTQHIPNIYFQRASTIDVRTSVQQMDVYLRGVKRHARSQGPGRGSEVTVCELLQQTSRLPQSIWPARISSQCCSLARGIVQIGTSLPKAIADAIAQVELEL